MAHGRWHECFPGIHIAVHSKRSDALRRSPTRSAAVRPPFAVQFLDLTKKGSRPHRPRAHAVHAPMHAVLALTPPTRPRAHAPTGFSSISINFHTFCWGSLLGFSSISIDFQTFCKGSPLGFSYVPIDFHDFFKGPPLGFSVILIYFVRALPWDFHGFPSIFIHFVRGHP